MRSLMLVLALVCFNSVMQRSAHAQSPYYGGPYGYPYGNAYPAPPMNNHHHHHHHGSGYGSYNPLPAPSIPVTPYPGNYGWGGYPNIGGYPNVGGYPSYPYPGSYPTTPRSQYQNHPWHPGHYLFGI